MSDTGHNDRDRMQMIQSSQCRRTNIESMESATRALGLNMSFHSISRQKDQNIEDHHIDEVIKYYWCWGNSEKIKDENFNLFVFSFARVSPLSLGRSVVTICLTRFMARCRNSIDYVSLSLLFCDFFLLYLPCCLIESFFELVRIAFLLAHFLRILPLEIESKSLLLLKYNIIVGERRRRRRERDGEKKRTTFQSKVILSSRSSSKSLTEEFSWLWWVEVSLLISIETRSFPAFHFSLLRMIRSYLVQCAMFSLPWQLVGQALQRLCVWWVGELSVRSLFSLSFYCE